MATVYMAGPLFTLHERVGNKLLCDRLRELMPSVDFVLPQESAKEITATGDEFSAACFRMCEESVKSADLVLANADGPDMDSGTAIECGMAYAFGKPVIVWRTDFRKAGDDSNNTNLMVTGVARGNVVYSPAYDSETPDDIDALAKVLAEKISSVINK